MVELLQNHSSKHSPNQIQNISLKLLFKSQQFLNRKPKTQTESKYPYKRNIETETKYQPQNEAKKEAKVENKYLRQIGRFALGKSLQIASSKNQPPNEKKVETKTETKYPSQQK